MKNWFRRMAGMLAAAALVCCAGPAAAWADGELRGGGVYAPRKVMETADLAETDGLEDKSGGLVFTKATMPKEETTWQAGSGTITWKPVLDGNNEVTSAELTLKNATINATTGEGGITASVPLEIQLEGANTITASGYGINMTGGTPSLTITGSGSLKIDSQSHAIYLLQRQGKFLVKDISLTVKSNEGYAIYTPMYSEIQFENSQIWLSTKSTNCETIYCYSSALNIKAGKLYVENLGGNMELYSSDGKPSLSNGALVYFKSNTSYKIYSDEGSESGGVWYRNSTYSKEGNVDSVSPGNEANVVGTVQWKEGLFSSLPNEMIIVNVGDIWGNIPGTLMIPSGADVTIEKQVCILVYKNSKFQVENNASVLIEGQFTISDGAVLTNNGTINEAEGATVSIPSSQRLERKEIPPAPSVSSCTDDSIVLECKEAKYPVYYGYKASNSDEIKWQETNRMFQELQPGIEYMFYVRYSGTPLYNESGPSAPLTTYTRYPTPNISVNYETETLENFEPNAQYDIKISDGTDTYKTYTADGEGHIKITQESGEMTWDWFGKVITIVRKGNADDKIQDSTDQSLPVNGYQDAPAALTAVPTSFADEKDGKFTGFQTGKTYQYRPKGDPSGEWQTLTEDMLFAAGTYEVRFAAVPGEKLFASKPVEKEIELGPEKTYGIQLTPGENDTLEFGAVPYGDEIPAAQNVTVKNIGNQPVTIGKTDIHVANNFVLALSAGFTDETANIPAGETAVFSIQPARGLSCGEYTGTIEVTAHTGRTELDEISMQGPAVHFAVKVPAPVIGTEGELLGDTKEFIDSLTVKISCAVEGAEIYYTLDGTAPTKTSTKYDPAAGITLTDTTTVKAIAATGELPVSDVCEATYIKHTRHTYDEGEVTTAPTCTTDGVKTFTCTVCHEVETETIPATGQHDYKAEVTKEPTTEEEGVRTYTCTVCGDFYTEPIDKLPEEHTHTYGDWTVTTPPTCVDEGEETRECACGEKETRIIPATGQHDYKAEVTKQPTTEEEGVRTYTCTVCGDSYTEPIAKLPEEHTHTYGDWTVTTPPTCVDEGEETRECVCGEKETRIIPATGRHDYKAEVTKEPTTEEEGVRTYTCTVCGTSYTEPIDKLPAPEQPVTPPSTPGEAVTPPPYVPPAEKDNWQEMQPAAEDEDTMWKYIEDDGTVLTGGHWLTGTEGKARLYLFDRDGALQAGVKKSAIAPDGSEIIVSAQGDVWMNGNRYYLNPDRTLARPRSCYAVTDYERVLPNNAGVTYYDKNGITFQGWLRGSDGSMRYQIYIQPDGNGGGDFYLMVWRVQTLPACQDPDHPGDPAWTIPAGRYFFDDRGVRVTAEGWYDGRDGKEYYVNANGLVLAERIKE